METEVLTTAGTMIERKLMNKYSLNYNKMFRLVLPIGFNTRLAAKINSHDHGTFEQHLLASYQHLF